jgi:hypothetical protein
MVDREQKSPESRIVGQYTIKELLGGQLLPRNDIDRDDIYRNLGDVSLIISGVKSQNEQEITIQGLPVTGIELNALLHYAAPSRQYGIDTGDLLGDWVNIYDPTNAELLKKHIERYIGPENWSLFESVKDSVWRLIKRDSATDTLMPVVRLRKIEGGNWEWSLNREEMEVLGPALIAAFSPDITTIWPKKIGQDMGTTQALPLTLMKRADLLGSKLIKQIIGLAETGQIPQIEQTAESKAGMNRTADPSNLTNNLSSLTPDQWSSLQYNALEDNSYSEIKSKPEPIITLPEKISEPEIFYFKKEIKEKMINYPKIKNEIESYMDISELPDPINDLTASTYAQDKGIENGSSQIFPYHAPEFILVAGVLVLSKKLKQLKK